MTVKFKLIYLICMVLCVLITLSTVSAADFDGELISHHDSVAKISQSESSITNLNENINDIGIYSEDKDCVDSVNGLSNLNSIEDSYSDLNSIEDSYSDLNSINSDEKSLKSSLSTIDSSKKSYENDLNDDLSDKSILNDDSSQRNDLISISNEKNTLKSNSLGATTGSFAELQNMINNASSGSTINLGGKTFIGNGTTIRITKPITIDGGSENNKATLDGNFISNITAISCSDVHIINCNFKNDLDYAISISANNTSVKNCNFINNSLHLFVSSYSKNFLLDNCNLSFGYRNEGTNAYVDAANSTVRNCNFINNTIFDDTGIMGYGGALQIGTLPNATNVGYVINCNFINNTVITNNNQTHAGALCFRPGIKVSNCNFINNYCNKVGGATTLHADGEILNCTFINNTAGEYGGAISTGFEWDDISVNITNCTFINNSAPMGGAIQIKGHNVKVTNSIFEDNKANESEGGAVFIVGNYALIINSTFKNNFAKTVGAGILINGSDAAVLNSSFDRNSADYGAAVYVIGSNANLFSSNFTNHNVKNGSVYIKGIDTYVYDSIFENNYGKSGAGLYIEGSNATIISSNFGLNNVTQKGGAIYIDGSYAQLILSSFLNNNAIPNNSDINTGLGGAIYIKGDNNIIDSSIFNYNTARNGSAIYTDGLHMTLSSTSFDRNQAWSYSLESNVNPPISYFNESDILINFTLIGGNNIANAIYNTVSMNQIYFYNISYISSKGEKHTGNDEIHPVDGAQNSNDGSLLYQDDREDNQLVNVIIYKYLDNEDDEYPILSFDLADGGFSSLNSIDDESISNVIILNQTFRTGILGDIAFNLSDYIDGPLETGKYLIYAEHYEDDYYKEIDEANEFEIIPIVDLAITIGSSRVNIDFNKTVKYTIKIDNYGPNNATGTKVNARIPDGLIYLSSATSIGSYDENTGIWTIGDLNVGDNQTLVINVLTDKTGIIDFPVNISSNENDSNEKNNFNNKTIRVLMADLAIDVQLVDGVINYGDTVDWTITVKNNGPNNASKITVSILPLNNDLIYLNSSNDTFNDSNLIWEIPALLVDDEISLVITTKVNSSNNDIELIANVSSDTYDPIPSNNLDSDIVNVLPLCDLIIKVNVSQKEVDYGDIVDWLILVSNDGPDDAKDVSVSLSDLESLGLVVLDVSGDSFDKNNYDWIVGDLDSGDSVSLTIKTEINSSNKDIIVNGTVFTDTFEINKENNKDSDNLTITPLCDLAIEISVSNSTVNYGGIVDLYVVVSNDGPDDAEDVTVSLSDLESLGLIVLNSSMDSFNKEDKNWTIGNLKSGENISLTINTITDRSNANITILSEVDTSTLEMNKENNHDNDSLNILPSCDVVVSIRPDNDPASVGDIVNWIINVTNIGPDNASDVNVFNSLPDGLEFILSELTKGELENATHEDGAGMDFIWKVGDLENNESAFLVISTNALEEGIILNNASASSSTFDLNESNNFDSSTLNVIEEDNSNGADNTKRENEESEDNGDYGSDGNENEGSGDNGDEGNDDEETDNELDEYEDDNSYDDLPILDYGFLDKDNSEKSNDDSDKDNSKSDKSKEHDEKNSKRPIDISSKKSGNPLAIALLSIFALFSLAFRKN